MLASFETHPFTLLINSFPCISSYMFFIYHLINHMGNSFVQSFMEEVFIGLAFKFDLSFLMNGSCWGLLHREQ